MSHIDPAISATAINKNQKAVIEKYNFSLHSNFGQFELTDAVIRKANRGKGGKHTGGNLDILLAAAVNERKALDASLAAPSDQVTNAAVRAKTNPPKKAKTPKSLDENAAAVLGDSRGPRPVDMKSLDEVRTLAGADATNDHVAADETAPVKDAEGDAPAHENDPAHDDTSKRTKRAQRASLSQETSTKPERKPRVKKVKEPKVRKDNRYLRTARIVAEDLTFLPTSSKDREACKKRLAAAVGDISPASAGHFFEAWMGITAILTAKGWLTIPTEK